MYIFLALFSGFIRVYILAYVRLRKSDLLFELRLNAFLLY
jgi:hypothetical protein